MNGAIEYYCFGTTNSSMAITSTNLANAQHNKHNCLQKSTPIKQRMKQRDK